MDRNFKSFEQLTDRSFSGEVLIPTNPSEWADTVKVWKCFGCYFQDFTVVGGKEDVADLSPETSACVFKNWAAASSGNFVFTIKGGSKHNLFQNIHITRGGSEVDIDIGNWSSRNFDPSPGNRFVNVWRSDGKPVTVRYRFFGCRPILEAGDYKILWFQCLGLTAYWWAKYVWHIILKRPDKNK